MSYCRWSSDDYQCDVYVYEDCFGGWTTHVAGRRPVFNRPLPPPVPFDDEHVDEWIKRHQLVLDEVQTAEHVDIGLPHDSQSFNHGTPGECADWLEELRRIGYNVPQYAIDALREEQNEINNAPQAQEETDGRT